MRSVTLLLSLFASVFGLCGGACAVPTSATFSEPTTSFALKAPAEAQSALSLAPQQLSNTKLTPMRRARSTNRSLADALDPVLAHLLGGGHQHLQGLSALHFFNDRKTGVGVRWSLADSSSQQFGPLNVGISVHRRRQLSLDGPNGPPMRPALMLAVSRELSF